MPINVLACTLFVLNSDTHAFADTIRRPLTAPPAAYTGEGVGHHWNEIEGQNKLALELLRADRGMPAIQVLDAFELSRLRGDRHQPGDCLHYCLPGPPDDWNRMLLYMLDRA